MASQDRHRRQITGTSDVSVDDAIGRALNVARLSFGEPEWFDVLTARGFLSDGRVSHYQVTLDLGYPDTEEDAGDARSDYFERAFEARRRGEVRHTIEMRF